MHADLRLNQRPSGIIRVFDRFANWSDPYALCVAFQEIDAETVEIMGLIGRPGGQTRAVRQSEIRALERSLSDAGYRRWRMTRYKHGRQRCIEFNIEKRAKALPRLVRA